MRITLSRHIKVKMQMLSALVLFACALMVTGALAGNASAASRDCDNNAIMKCGFSSHKNFVDKTNDNTPGDLKAIYSDYGLTPSMYDKFATQAKDGTAYKDGRIVVDGQVVGHASQSIGRQQINGNTQKVVINGKTYWGGPNSATFGSDSLPVSVLFNDKGVMQFAVLQNCGNPETITPVTPSYSCNQINKTAVAGKANTYSFTTSASASKNAQVVNAVYDFGNGQTQTVTNLNQAVTHTFTGDATVKVTVYVKVPGGSTATATSIHCQTPIKFVPPAQPYATCTSLTPEQTDASTNTYRFTALANYGGGAKFNYADFDLGDGVVMTNVLPEGNQAMISHSYADTAARTITATLHFTNPDKTSRQVTCQTNTTAPPTTYCKPGVVTGSPECTETPPTLVNTGSSTGTMVGIFGGVSSLAAAGHWFFRRRLTA